MPLLPCSYGTQAQLTAQQQQAGLPPSRRCRCSLPHTAPTHLQERAKGVGPARPCALRPQPRPQDGSVCQQVQRVGDGDQAQGSHALRGGGAGEVLRVLDAVAAGAAAAAGGGASWEGGIDV